MILFRSEIVYDGSTSPSPEGACPIHTPVPVTVGSLNDPVLEERLTYPKEYFKLHLETGKKIKVVVEVFE